MSKGSQSLVRPSPSQGGTPAAAPTQPSATNPDDQGQSMPEGSAPAVAGVTPVQPGQSSAVEEKSAQDANGQTIGVTLRHRTPHHAYRRAGLVLTKDPKQFEVTSEQLEILKADTHVVVVDPAATTTDEEVKTE